MDDRVPASDTCRDCGMPLAYDRYMNRDSPEAANEGLCSFCASSGRKPLSPSRSGPGEKLLDLMIDTYNAGWPFRRACARRVARLGRILPDAVVAPMKVLASVPHKSPDAPFDAVVLYSGGKDSSYMLLSLARRNNLRLCAWMLQQGYQAPGAIANARRLCERIGVPLHIEAPGKSVMDRVFRVGFDVDGSADVDLLRSVMTYGSACGPCFTAIASFALDFCRRNGPAFCFIGTQEGQNRMDLSGKPVLSTDALPRMDYMVTHAFAALRRHVDEALPDALPALKTGACPTALVPFYEFVRKPPLDEQLAVLTEAGWEMPHNTGACSTNCMVNELGRQVMRARFGFDLYQIMAANERRLQNARSKASVSPPSEDPVDLAQAARAAKMMGLSAAERQRYGLPPEDAPSR